MQRVCVLGSVILIWALAAACIVVLTAKTNALWHAEAGYLLTAASVTSAWAATHALLRLGRLRCAYRPTPGRSTKGGDRHA